MKIIRKIESLIFDIKHNGKFVPHCYDAPKMYQKEFGYSWKCWFRRKCKKSCIEGIGEMQDTWEEVIRQKLEDLNEGLSSAAAYIGMGGSEEDIRVAKDILGEIDD